jgi:hypothetical protein
MLIIGLDYHPSFQQIAFIDNETGEYGERGLLHQNGEAERFYRELKQRGVNVGLAKYRVNGPLALISGPVIVHRMSLENLFVDRI